MAEVNNFDVLKAMAAANLDIQLAPLDNLVRATAGKAGTQVTIGVPGNIVGALMNGKYLGGLILADAKQYAETRRKLSTKNGTEES